ncbi:hypothetical protein ACIB24_14740 [Spongisporangium articulatum]|uniref:Uncharacterized protein n=1 Tax=Spongisporangium articulatum TaxID=3362603 RepID=A0ABW8APN6_9ACTN
MAGSMIGEAKKHISDANEQSVAAQKAIDAAKEAAGEALELVKKAAEDSEHDLVLEAIKGYEKALEALEDAKKEITDAQAAADKYAEEIG